MASDTAEHQLFPGKTQHPGVQAGLRAWHTQTHPERSWDSIFPKAANSGIHKKNPHSKRFNPSVPTHCTPISVAMALLSPHQHLGTQ